MSVEKTRTFKTIEISTETYEQLRRFQRKISEIMERKVSFDKLIRILIAINPTDELMKVYLGEE
jgi:predicted CopG family antitoxin